MTVHTDQRNERPDSPEDSGTEDSGTQLKSVEGAVLSPRGVRLELILLVVLSAIWLLALLGLFQILPLAGTFDLNLYRLYSVAAVLGWISGNIYVMRCRTLPDGGRWRKRLLLAYLLGPPGMVYLIRSLASPSLQQAAPLVPIYSVGVYAIFFLIPVTLRSTEVPRTRL